MKQEQRLTAEVYRFLAPFVDTTKGIFISLDGQAAEIGVQQGLFAHATIPDLWFTFVGARAPTLIESKIVRPDNRVLVMQSQLQAWRSSGRGPYRPSLWIAAAESFEKFYLWSHANFLPRLDATRAVTATIPIRLPNNYIEFRQANELALEIIRIAKAAPSDP